MQKKNTDRPAEDWKRFRWHRKSVSSRNFKQCLRVLED